jgi:hypothetical protein
MAHRSRYLSISSLTQCDRIPGHMYHDERFFDKPHEFLPERFLLNTHGTRPGCKDDPARSDNLLFGGGLRICPGMAIAKTTMVNSQFLQTDKHAASEIIYADKLPPPRKWLGHTYCGLSNSSRL